MLDLLAQGGLAAFDRQLAFAELVGDLDWQLDQDAGILCLGSDLAVPAQLLGSVSDSARTWLWAWANPSVAEGIARTSERVRSLGAERDVSVLTDPEVDLFRIGDPHLLALAVSGIADADAYYRCPYAGGAAFVLVELGDGRPRVDLDPSNRAADVVGRAIIDVPQLVSRQSVERYIDDLGAQFTAADGAIRMDAGPSFQFDELGRLKRIEDRRGP